MKTACAFRLEVAKRCRETVGDDFIIIFRIAAMDMLQGGMSWDEVALLARELEKVGVSMISTHFTWHESAVPTIATMVPRAAFTSVTGRVRKEVSIPVITSNRINMPQVAEDVLAAGEADLGFHGAAHAGRQPIYEQGGGRSRR